MNESIKVLGIMKRFSFRHYLILFCGLVGLCFILPYAVHGQETTILSVTPSEAEVNLATGETVAVDLWVSNAENLNGFDITLTYDPALIQLESWEHGGFLTNMFDVTQVNDPGIFRLGSVQLAQPGKSGDGSLLKLTFSGVSLGSSAVTITQAVFADPGGNQSIPDLEGGSIIVFPPRFTVSGLITLQGQTVYDGIPFMLGVGETYQYGPYTGVTNSQTDINLQMDKVVGDTYLVTTQQPRYLNLHEGLNLQLSVSSDIILPDLYLFGGNAVWMDNKIDIADASVVGAWYNLDLSSFGPDLDYHPDVNFDGIVNIQDLSVVAGNFDLTSAEVYADWQP